MRPLATRLAVLTLSAALPLGLLAACGSKTTDDTGAATTADGGSTTDGGAATDGGTDGGSDGGAATAELHTIDADTLAGWLGDDTDFLLINTHVPYAGDIPGTDLDIAYTDGAELVAAIGDDLDRTTVVYCMSGSMSAQAADTLVAAGYREIYDLTGGMNAWVAAGYDLKK